MLETHRNMMESIQDWQANIIATFTSNHKAFQEKYERGVHIKSVSASIKFETKKWLQTSLHTIYNVGISCIWYSCNADSIASFCWCLSNEHTISFDSHSKSECEWYKNFGIEFETMKFLKWKKYADFNCSSIYWVFFFFDLTLFRGPYISF